MIAIKLDRALFGGDLAENIEEHMADDGRVYYVDKNTKQSTWQKPAAYAAVISAMEVCSMFFEKNLHSHVTHHRRVNL